MKEQRRIASQFDQPSNEGNVEGDKNHRTGTKHDLTPGSKQNPNQSKSKRSLVGKVTYSFRNHLFIINMKKPQFEFIFSHLCMGTHKIYFI